VIVDQEALKPWVYAAGLVVAVAGLAIANFALGYLAELANIEPGTPAVAALALVQGLAGALIAAFASGQLFKSIRPADFWLKWIVILVTALFAIVIVWLLVTGKAGKAMTWATYAGVAALVGTEIGRRLAKGLFGRARAGEVAAPLPD
jgi:membrane protease YdiL (CAAX protease family)